MAQFPVSDQQGILDGINYILSGPSGTGQNSVGISLSSTGLLTGNYRAPYTLPLGGPQPSLDVSPIALSTSEMLDGRTWKFTFAAPESIPPFVVGQGVTVSGVADSNYDGDYNIIGTVECTTTYVIVRTNGTYPIIAPSTGGTVEFHLVDGDSYSTDCNGKVTVTNVTDTVNINMQLTSTPIVLPGTGGNLAYEVTLNRYSGFVNPDPTNPDYKFSFEETLASKQYVIDPTASPTTIDTTFVGIVDKPVKGYYWYIVELKFGSTDPVLKPIVTEVNLGLRSFSAQVVKA